MEQRRNRDQRVVFLPDVAGIFGFVRKTFCGNQFKVNVGRSEINPHPVNLLVKIGPLFDAVLIKD